MVPAINPAASKRDIFQSHMLRTHQGFDATKYLGGILLEEKYVGKIMTDVNVLILNLLKSLRAWDEVLNKLVVRPPEDVAYFQDCVME